MGAQEQKDKNRSLNEILFKSKNNFRNRFRAHFRSSIPYGSYLRSHFPSLLLHLAAEVRISLYF